MDDQDSLRRLSDIGLMISVELPCQRLSVREVLALEPGRVVVTPRAAGDSVDIRIGRDQIAEAEMIVIGNTLAVRISDLSESPQGFPPLSK